MKKYVLALFVFSALISCKDNPVSKKIKETKEAVSNSTNAVQEITPLTNEEFKSWMPEEVNGMKRISYKAGQAGMMGIASIEAAYANEDKSKKFSISIIDGAGQVGSAATAGLRMVMTQDFEEEDENGSRRTVTKNGTKAIEEYRSNNNNSKIQLMESNRFYLEANGKTFVIDFVTIVISFI